MRRRLPQKHGLTCGGRKHPIYKLRERMIYYCNRLKETHPSFPSYRGKGIKVCDEWIDDIKSFYSWCIDNGWKKGLTIDRIDSNGDYEPSNCQFISQSANSIKARSENDQRGEKGTGAKLNDDKVMAIKLLLRLGFAQRKIANFFGMGKTAIGYINSGKSWKHIKEI